MTGTHDPREQLKNALLELQSLRQRLKAVEREQNERAAIIGAARLSRPAVGFDAARFGLDAAALEAASQALLAQTAWLALEHAGRPPASLPAERVGVFIGYAGSEPGLRPAQTVARAFGFGGPAVNVEAGEASALAAVDLACRALLAGALDVALAGEAAADGCSLVVLKRLSAAVEQRDAVLAVVHAHRAYFSAAEAANGGPSALVDAVHAVQAGAGGPITLTAGRDSRASLELHAPPPMPQAAAAGPHLLLLSAHDAPALDAVARGLAAQLREQPAAVAGVAYTLRAGRAHWAHRRYLVADDGERASTALEQGDGAEAVTPASNRPPVFLFPGLGSHYLNMGRGLYEAEPIFREAVDECARLLAPHLGVDVRTLIFADGDGSPAPGNGAANPGQLDLRRMLRRDSGPANPAAARLDQTLHAQPALFVIEYALACLLRAWGVQPAAMLGYSLGEYVAACLAGVLSLEDALRLVAARARLIQALPAGKMLAVPLPEAELAPWLQGEAAIAAVNGAALCVVAGEPAAIDALAARLAEAGHVAQALPTTHAFHTHLLRPMANAFREALSAVTLRAPAVPYVSNLTGDWITPEQATSPNYWIEHSCRPVRFAAGLGTLRRAGYRLFVEAGPSQVLSSLVLAVAREAGAEPVRAVPTMRAGYDPQPDTRVLLKAAGELWLAGAEVDWEALQPARRVPLPPYPFEHAAPSQAAPAAAGEPGTLTEQALAALWRDLLRVPTVDLRRTFFEHGGNSLLATQLIFRIKKTFGITVPLRALYEAPGLAAMASLIDGRASHAPAVGANGGASAAPADGGGVPVTLPNGLAIVCQNRPEVEHFYNDIFVERVYASHGIRLPPGAVVFDVGANIGLFSLFAHFEAPGARSYAFEPAPPLFALLEANRRRHGVAGMAYNCALAGLPGTAQLTYYPKSTGMSSLHADLAEEKRVLETVLRNQVRRGERELAPLLEHAADYLDERFKAVTFACQVRTLSDVLAETGVDRVDLLKIDVQKAELDVLLGLSDGDWPKVRQVVVEVHDSDGRLEQMRQMLAARGFQVACDQEALYAGSDIYLLYAVRAAGV